MPITLATDDEDDQPVAPVQLLSESEILDAFTEVDINGTTQRNYLLAVGRAIERKVLLARAARAQQ